MLKLLIVEDEMLVRLGLKTMLDWNSLDVEIIGEADDGEKGLQMARNFHPDLVITDISMPKMDGLELIKVLRKELPGTKVVVLSCHRDYEYVREAMQNYGALDYLLKIKLEPEELRKVILRARETIEKENKKAGEYQDLQWQMNSNIYDVKSKLFNDLLDVGSPVPTDIINRLKLMKINFEDSWCVPVCILLDNYSELCDDQRKIRLLIFSILNICGDMINVNGYMGEAFYKNNSEFGMILFYNNFDSKEAESKTMALCRQLQSNFKMFLNISTSFGIGKGFNGVQGLGEAYLSAYISTQERFYIGNGVICKSCDYNKYSNKLYLDSSIERALRCILEERKETEVLKVIEGMLGSIERERISSPSRVMEELKEVLNMFSNNIRLYGIHLKELKDERDRDPYVSLSNCGTLQEVKEWFGGFITQYFRFLNSLNLSKFRKEVNLALKFIETHYTEDISLQDTADFLHLNNSYFSFIFKKETGKNFTEYLNIFRVEKAKEYLRMPEMTVSEVWEKVGYSSLSYFSRVFKQYTSMGPAEYKRDIQK